MGGEDYLSIVTVFPDEKSHITIKNPKKCGGCALKACLVVCPSAVFVWDASTELVDVLWRRCVECGACEPACPGNVEYKHPRGGFGVRNIM